MGKAERQLNPGQNNSLDNRQNIVRFAVFVTGVSEGIVQVIVLREILAGFYGTELLIGAVLAGWMAVNSLGCLLASRFSVCLSLRFLLCLQIIIGAAAFLTCGGMLAGCSLLASNSHSQVNWLSYSILSLLVFLPFCLLSGIQYAVSVKVLAGLPGQDGLRSASGCYICNSAGMLAGFLFSTFFLITSFNTIESGFIALGLNLLAAALGSILATGLKKADVILATAGIVIYAGIFSSGLPDLLYQKAVMLRTPAEKLEEAADTGYSRLLATSCRGQYNIYRNGFMEGAFPDFDPAMEKRVHFALLMHPDPQRVFIMGGLTGGVLQEVLKHHPQEVVYNEIDTEYLNIVLRYLKKSSAPRYEGVEFVGGDVRSYFRHAGKRFDVIILIPPAPATLSAGRLYSEEFFRLAKNALQPDGLLCTSVYSSETYVGKNMQRLNNSVFKALSGVFTNIVLIPGEEGIVLSSESAWDEATLGQTVLKRFRDRRLTTTLVSPEYITLMFDHARMKEARDYFSYDGLAVANSDYFPSAVQYYAAVLNEREDVAGRKAFDWFSAQPPARLFLAFFLLMLLPFVSGIVRKIFFPDIPRRPPLRYNAFLSGFTGYSCVFILIYLYQINVGSLYGDIGMISAANLCGYSVGALLAGGSGGGKNRTINFVFSGAGVLLLAVLFTDRWPYFISSKPVFILLILLWGILSGAVYPLLSKYASGSEGSGIRPFLNLYVSELAGAAVGAALTGMVLLGSAGFHDSMLIVIAALGCNMLSVSYGMPHMSK